MHSAGKESTQPPPSFREKLSWCLFDFANSSFTTVIVTFVFAVYFTKVVVGEEGFLGLKGDTLWNQAAGLSQLIVIFSAPIIGAMADRTARKKKYLFRSYVVCVAATALLTFMGPGTVVIALLLFVVANVAFSTGENLVAGFLPELTTPEKMGRLSGYGWAVGYAGGLLALVLALWLVKSDLVPWTSMCTALFFLVAGLPTFIFLRERAIPSPLPESRSLLKAGFQELLRTWSERQRFRDLFRFLLCVLFFQSGVVIVIVNASIYGTEEIGMSLEEMTMLAINLNIAAGVAAFSFGFVQDRFGSRPTLLVTLMLWIGAVLIAWLARDAMLYSVAGVVAGAAMGSSQSASRALVGMLCPRGREAEWFGLWGLATKTGAVAGPLVYSIVVQLSDRRTAILMTAAFFVLGIVVLLTVNVDRGRQAAR